MSLMNFAANVPVHANQVWKWEHGLAVPCEMAEARLRQIENLMPAEYWEKA
jgi:DNA-binding transcriptional regulator YiaG